MIPEGVLGEGGGGDDQIKGKQSTPGNKGHIHNMTLITIWLRWTSFFGHYLRWTAFCVLDITSGGQRSVLWTFAQIVIFSHGHL